MKNDLLATKLKDMRLEPQVSNPHESTCSTERVHLWENETLCFKVRYFPQLDLHFLDMPGFKSYVAGPIEEVLQIIAYELKVKGPSTK
jgi:hypothetical protein